MSAQTNRLVCCLFVLAVFSGPGLVAASASAQPADEPPTTEVAKMLEAVKDNSYDTFIAQGDRDLRTSFTKTIFDDVASALGERLGKGYKQIYLNELHQRGETVHLWKVEFADGKDEDLLKTYVVDGRITRVMFRSWWKAHPAGPCHNSR